MSVRPDRENLPYRDCVGTALFNAKGEVFLGRRMSGDDPEHSPELGAPWQMPQGGIDDGETPLNAALRELHEETGVRSVRLLREAPAWIYYDVPDDLLGIAYNGRFRGQRQRWFAFSFTGPEAEIDVARPGDGTVEAEFDAWRWTPLAEAPSLIVAFKRDAYEQVVEAFSDLPARLQKGET